ncbi:ribose 5-phosphate isomerase B [Aquimarina muelleri]|uniref:Ribose 5-phosphate isomerase B n=1 Tax=Aquimarina muelleri TaxID=279356 RepID=A0A918N3H2_9FLAO|nr:ribose 5-phosphate isomerase B [Aquimarina muelleri]MCX2763188.1 ribose 5-phosphate isomerase B [Aquimarina muelleri]GGX19826.1 ribose 5-phosphate isomerase B [Aquimarina muelleri]
MKIAIGNDHAGTEYKIEVAAYLESKGIEVVNYGTNENNSVDYPDFVHPVAKDVNSKKVDFGILICGSGNGVAMTANKYPNVRAGLCWTKEITELTRLHNDANIICIPARFTSLPQAIEMVKTFLDTNFEGGRHLNRVNKIPMCI